MNDLDEFKIILQNQVDALNNGQFDFLLYEKGSGGEFLCSLICKYSKKYGNITFKGYYDENGRFLEGAPPMFASAFVGGMEKSGKLGNKYTEIDTNKIMEYLENKELFAYNSKYNKFKSNYLILDNHLNSGGRFLIRSHFVFKKYMNLKNTYYMNCDSIYWKIYRYNLCRIKLCSVIDHCKGSSIQKSTISLFSKDLLMSKLFEKGYLENIFDIDNDNFHNELIQWHKRNKKLINNYLEK